MSNPITEVHLLCVPLDSTNKDQIHFESKTEQTNYFASKIRHTFDNLTFQRWDTVILVDANFGDILDSNYVMYDNGDRWVYAFITKIEYKNQGLSIVHMETDVYQTWQFDVTFLDSFVVREHVTDDTIGKNLVDEGLEIGEFVYSDCKATEILDSMSIVVSLSPTKDDTLYYGQLYSGIYSGLQYVSFSADSGGVGALKDLLETIVNAGHIDRIVNIFMMPTAFITSPNIKAYDYDLYPVTRPTTLNGYTPKNNKLFTFPYSFLYVSNNNGGSANFKYEYMSDKDHPQFTLIGDFSPSPTVYLYPNNYKGLTKNYEEKLSISNYPLCSWNNDVFATWLSQNRASRELGIATNIIEVGAGVALESPITTAHGIAGLLGQLAQTKNKEVQPFQARGNTMGGGSALAIGIQDFFFMPTTITYNFAERIDKFFDMFGYKVATVKKPNLNTRPYWNYVQTIDINIKGDIPSMHMEKLKSIFNNGVTLWSDGDNIGNYSLNNH